MTPDAVIAALVSIIGTLSGVITLLWRRHLADDARKDKEYEDLKLVATTASSAVGTFGPAVGDLTDAVKVVDDRAQERYSTIREDVKALRTDVLSAIKDLDVDVRDSLRRRTTR